MQHPHTHDTNPTSHFRDTLVNPKPPLTNADSNHYWLTGNLSNVTVYKSITCISRLWRASQEIVTVRLAYWSTLSLVLWLRVSHVCIVYQSTLELTSISLPHAANISRAVTEILATFLSLSYASCISRISRLWREIFTLCLVYWSTLSLLLAICFSVYRMYRVSVD